MFHTLPATEQSVVKRAFDTLSTTPEGASCALINEVALPHICRVMNLCVTEEDMYQICVTLGRGSQAYRGPQSEQGQAPNSLILPPTEFDYDAVKRIYDAYQPLQAANVKLFFQFFNLLDVHEVGSVSQADLRHCLCSAGDRLSDDEFHHLLYANDLLHKPQITIFEFTRLLLRVVPPPAPSAT